MLDLLRSQIPESVFATVWGDTLPLPPYEVFLQEAADRLGKQIHHPVEAVEASIKNWGRNRARIDGGIQTSAGKKKFYAELVWLPTYQTFRGEAQVSDPLPEIQPKSVDQFIAALEAVSEERSDVGLGYQAYDAGVGIDEEDPDIRRAFPAIFALFERFPDEDFESPEMLFPLLQERGGFEELLNASLTRKPTVAAVLLTRDLTYEQGPPAVRKRWIGLLEDVLRSPKSSQEVRNAAESALADIADAG